MRVTIQIPCFNEAHTLPVVLSELPKELPGVESIEIVVIDDGSTDETAAIALQHGATRVLQVPGRNRRWLGRAFRLGMEDALRRGTDILVNTDGDNQYPGRFIVELIDAIQSGEGDIAIGDRFSTSLSGNTPEPPDMRVRLSLLGNRIISLLSGVRTPDALSGFRAYSKRALSELVVIANDSYTIDTLLQAYNKGLDVVWVPMTVNAATRPSRVFRRNWDAVCRSTPNILRAFFVYQPLRLFIPLAGIFFLTGMFFIVRFLVFFFLNEGVAGHIQSLIAAAICMLGAFQFLALAVIGDALSVLRIMTESLVRRLR